MRRNAAFALATAALLSLGGCGVFGGGDKEEPVKPEVTAPEEAAFVPVASIRNLEIGRTRQGAAITAFGYAPGLGYATPELRARRDGKVGPDGYLDYDFMVQEPHSQYVQGQGTPEARLVRADILLLPRNLAGVRGIRVHAASGGAQMNF